MLSVAACQNVPKDVKEKLLKEAEEKVKQNDHQQNKKGIFRSQQKPDEPAEPAPKEQATSDSSNVRLIACKKVEVRGLTFRVLGVLRPRGATRLDQVISSPAGPSGGSFVTHLLPGGQVPQVHGAPSPIPPWLPHFATPRSICPLATVVTGAHPLRRPPDAWLPGLPELLGRCYWLVASKPFTSWRGGCLAAGLVRSTVCCYCYGGCSALVVCVRRSRQV